MYLIGERINGMFNDIKTAIQTKDEKIIQQWVEKQLSSVVDALDVSVGPAAENPIDAMVWLVKTIRKFTDITLSIDTTKYEVMQAGIETAGVGKSIINSCSADEENLEKFIPLMKKHNSKMIVLTMTKNGIPRDFSSRVELAANIISKCVENEVDIENIFIDAVILPLNVAQDQCVEVLETISQIKLLSNPAPKTILGLSNVSQKTSSRSLINRTFLVLALSRGLDAAILDVNDRELIISMITAEFLLNKHIYCDNFIDSYLKNKKTK